MLYTKVLHVACLSRDNRNGTVFGCDTQGKDEMFEMGCWNTVYFLDRRHQLYKAQLAIPFIRPNKLLGEM